jgi:nucleoside-diphosphate-sugar epimerase
MRMGEPILVFGDGNQTRDFVNVSDVAYLFARTAIDNVRTPLTLNAGSGQPKRIKDIAKLLDKISKVGIEYINPKVGELGRKPHE